jgi:hypothetical protein
MTGLAFSNPFQIQRTTPSTVPMDVDGPCGSLPPVASTFTSFKSMEVDQFEGLKDSKPVRRSSSSVKSMEVEPFEVPQLEGLKVSQPVRRSSSSVKSMEVEPFEVPSPADTLKAELLQSLKVSLRENRSYNFALSWLKKNRPDVLEVRHLLRG